MTDGIRPNSSLVPIQSLLFSRAVGAGFNRDISFEKTLSVALTALATFGSFLKSVVRLLVDERPIVVDIAACQGNILTVLFFVKVVGVSDEEYRLILDHAVKQGHTHILESLVSHKDRLDKHQVYAFLCVATRSVEKLPIMKILIDSYLGDFNPQHDSRALEVLKLLCTARGQSTLLDLLRVYNIDINDILFEDQKTIKDVLQAEFKENISQEHSL